MATRRDLLASLPVIGTAFSVGGSALLGEGGAQAQEAPAALSGHFHPKGKAPSVHTIRVLEAAPSRLPFSDESDLEEAARGFIAPMADTRIMADAGNVAMDLAQFRFLDEQERFDSIHPSLHRIGWLNNLTGLFEVAPGIYQARGLDLANVTFVRGKTGWIVVDPVTTTETARASRKLLQNHVGENLPVSAVIYTHNRADLERVMAAEVTLDTLLADGTAQAEGNLAILGQLAGLMVEFDPRFEIMPGTRLRTEVAATSPYAAEISAIIPE